MRLKLNLFFILISFSLLNLSPTHGQEDDLEDLPAAPKNARIMDDKGDDLEAQMESVKKDNQQILEKLQALNPEQKAEFQEAINSGNMAKAGQLMEKFGIQAINPTTGEKQGTLNSLVSMSLESFRSMSDTQLKAHLDERIGSSALGGIYNKAPKLQNFLLRALKDREALPSFFSIIEQKKKLTIYLGITLFTMVVSWLWKRKLKQTERPFFESFIAFLFRFSFVWGIRLGAMTYLFHREFGPIIRLAFKSA
ncbi:MAG: hypothetical protein COW00_14960 [Bdellovibrio sp. CG12_big_fil_rev_8_21_14_0_65_39_13]|nr:MAG: hypothetical protein COW78_00515 [Bdellovibrio sp. CG22_combo_CG10-13_8_21_14_all_39_27]PIQ58591.1 MAG: hypothetical protein COW00_14960 [Bdellovibrio sp. CG12_big_fil_rev_8_21_14_0_65_39_13]PIR33799.1 MAG: hypothetical protein COV37_14920 [Bdellovibrio sp. CG11_big_fil_rev_8_21_14_0_20_39_38]